MNGWKNKRRTERFHIVNTSADLKVTAELNTLLFNGNTTIEEIYRDKCTSAAVNKHI